MTNEALNTPASGTDASGSEAVPKTNLTPGDIAALKIFCAAHTDEIFNPDYGHNVLLRHAQFLDDLFCRMSDGLLAPDLPADGSYNTLKKNEAREKRAKLTLQIQRQCMEALRTMSTVDYMQSLMHSPTPSPERNKL